MKKYNTDIALAKQANYYKIIETHLKKQHTALSQKEINVLCRETVFAPENYQTEIAEKPVKIASVRQNLADFIERDASAKNFIPYSLNAQLADLIEQSGCETSSMNEYYRWVSATSEIIRRTNDGDVTHADIDERKQFLGMSYDREAEILLCLALYQAAGTEQNRDKIDILRFKLARLREMRTMVANTDSRLHRKIKNIQVVRQKYEDYCAKLSQEVYYSFAFNLNLKLNDINEEDLDENYSHLDYLKSNVLNMMRRLELPKVQNTHTENYVQKEPLQLEILSQKTACNEAQGR